MLQSIYFSPKKSACFQDFSTALFNTFPRTCDMMWTCAEIIVGRLICPKLHLSKLQLMSHLFVFCLYVSHIRHSDLCCQSQISPPHLSVAHSVWKNVFHLKAVDGLVSSLPLMLAEGTVVRIRVDIQIRSITSSTKPSEEVRPVM